MHVKLGWFLFIVIGLLSCTSNVWFKKQYKIPDDEWGYDHILSYEMEVKDTISQHDIDLEVEYDEYVFSFQNVYVNIKTTFPDQKSTNQIVSLEILGEEAQMERNCSGTKCTVTILLLANFKFKLPGKHIIEISQFSRDEILKGISKIGLSVIKKDPL
jgi:gliding motility-associated lipoprotein GldH